MQAAQVLAGYTLGGADLLRRAMGKKDKEKMAKERVKFCEGAAKLHGIKENKANEVFDMLEKFAGYGFNRSHSAAYAWVSYQTAYLKANYPVEFMAAVMSNEVANTDKISIFVAECERMGITILPPDVNRSSLKFAPEKSGETGRHPLRPRRDQERRRRRDDRRHGRARARRPVRLAGKFRRPRRHEKGEPESARMPGEMRRLRLDRLRARAAVRARSTARWPPPPAPNATGPPARASLFDDFDAAQARRRQARRRRRDTVDRRRKARLRKGAARLLRHRPPARRIPPRA